MTGLAISKHGEIRMSQRGFRKVDLDTILRYGTDIGCDRIMLRRKDAHRIISMLKMEIKMLERVNGKVVVIKDDRLVTAYKKTSRIQLSRRRSKKRR